MSVDEKLYIDQMDLWIKEQEVIEEQIKRAVSYHDSLAASHVMTANLNREQRRHHRKRMKLAIEEFENWKKDNGIGGEIG